MGADTMVMLGAWGPCRFGYYCQMQQEILDEAGCSMDAIILEACAEGFRETLRRVSRLFGGIHAVKLLPALGNLAALAVAVDCTERLYRHTKALEKDRGSADAIYQNFRRTALITRGLAAMKALVRQTDRILASVPLLDARPLRIGIVGEIYGTIDPYTNLELESRLCGLGVEVERCVTISDWIVEHMIKKELHLPRDERFAQAAVPYLMTDIGGHTRETLGHTVLHARDGFDGVIQLYPLGCMPEIVAQGILPRISREMDIPILTLIIDEMTGETGYMTRVEAFLDLLYQRRQAVPAYPGDEWDPQNILAERSLHCP